MGEVSARAGALHASPVDTLGARDRRGPGEGRVVSRRLANAVLIGLAGGAAPVERATAGGGAEAPGRR